MARVEVSVAAQADLARLIASHSLPADTRERVKRSLRHLERFPLLGPALGGQWEGFRFLLGPWRWLILVYVYLEEDDRVVVITIQDGRAGTSFKRFLADAPDLDELRIKRSAEQAPTVEL